MKRQWSIGLIGKKDPIEASKKNTLAVASKLVQEFKGQADVVALLYDIHDGAMKTLLPHRH